VICPYCGYRMPAQYTPDAICKGLWLKCKGRQCGRTFEVNLPQEGEKKGQ